MKKNKTNEINQKINEEIVWLEDMKQTISEKILNDTLLYSQIKKQDKIIDKLKKFYKRKTDKFSKKNINSDVKVTKNPKKLKKDELKISNKSNRNKNKLLNKKNRVDNSIEKLKKLNQEKEINHIVFSLTAFTRYKGFHNLLKSVFKFLNENKLMLLILLISIIVGFLQPVFFTKRNIFTNIFKNNVVIGIMAIGMTFVILTGGIDLSVGSLIGFSGIYSMGFLIGGMPTILAFMLGILLSIVIGLISGLLVSLIKLPPFIITLVGLLSIRGIIYIYADGAPKTQIGNSTFDFINNTTTLGLPFVVLILIVFVFIGMFILKFTKFGRNVYSVGGNKEAAKLSGINTKMIITSVYVISGLMAGIASLFYASKISSVGPTAGNSYELDVIAAVVLGGTSLEGGKGGVGKTFLGWLVISTLSNALIILGFNSNWQLVFKGLIILVAVILDKNFGIINKVKKTLYKYI